MSGIKLNSLSRIKLKRGFKSKLVSCFLRRVNLLSFGFFRRVEEASRSLYDYNSSLNLVQQALFLN
jgi:hypothetical protein